MITVSSVKSKYPSVACQTHHRICDARPVVIDGQDMSIIRSLTNGSEQ